MDDLRRRLSQVQVDSSEARRALLTEQVSWLDTQCKTLARSSDARRTLCSQVDDDALARLTDVWNEAVRLYEMTEGDGDGQSSRFVEQQQDDVRRLTMCKAVLAARLVRNAVAENGSGQHSFFVVVPTALSVLWKTTTFTLEEYEEVQLLTRTLVQMLSNLVTDNEVLQSALWREHLGMSTDQQHATDKNRPSSDLLCRLLETRDNGTQTATHVLLLNLTNSSPTSCLDLTQTPAGSRTMRSLLYSVHLSLEADEGCEEAQEEAKGGPIEYDPTCAATPQTGLSAGRQAEQKRFEAMGILYTFFTNLFTRGLFDDAYDCLRSIMPHDSAIDVSVISAAQITLLKLLDSFLHFAHQRPTDGIVDVSAESQGYDRLPGTFESLARWAAETMTMTLRNVDAAVDSRLVDVHVGLVLTLQCLTTLAIATDASSSDPVQRVAGERLLTAMRQDGFLKTLLVLMRVTHVFSPAVSPFVPTAESGSAGTAVAPPEGHVLSSTGQAAVQQARKGDKVAPRPRLDKLKRDQVALLGVLAFQRGPHDGVAVRRVQDTVREQGGLLDVLNLTQMDERNPYIRERAIFALRSLLHANQASQDVIAQLKPVDASAAQWHV